MIASLTVKEGSADMQNGETSDERPLLSERFVPGVVVLISLNNPREKFWGVLLDLSTKGISVRGIELSSFDETVRMVRHEEPVDPSEVFFPMHRVERVEIDAPSCGIPSLSQRFETTTGYGLGKFLCF
jgi:hypothetical protein